MSIRFVALAFFASIALTPVGASAAPAAPRGSGGTFWAGGLIGFESARGASGLQLRLDGEIEQKTVSASARLSLVGSIGYTRFHDSTPWGWSPYWGWVDETWDATTDVFRVVPAVRLSFGRSPRVRPYVDAGVGLYHASERIEVRNVYGWTVERYSTSETNLMFRFAGGLLVQVSPHASIGAEVGLNPYVGGIDETMLSALFSVMLRT